MNQQRAFLVWAFLGVATITADTGFAQEEPATPTASIADLSTLLGYWDLTSTYTNGAVAKGSRHCYSAIGDTYIRCDSEVTFDENNRSRTSVIYINYNEGREVFEEVWIWEFPSGKIVSDLRLNEDGSTAGARGFVYAGEGGITGNHLYEEWSFSENKVTVVLKANTLTQPPDQWNVFFTDVMVRNSE